MLDLPGWRHRRHQGSRKKIISDSSYLFKFFYFLFQLALHAYEVSCVSFGGSETYHRRTYRSLEPSPSFTAPWCTGPPNQLVERFL